MDDFSKEAFNDITCTMLVKKAGPYVVMEGSIGSPAGLTGQPLCDEATAEQHHCEPVHMTYYLDDRNQFQIVISQNGDIHLSMVVNGNLLNDSDPPPPQVIWNAKHGG